MSGGRRRCWSAPGGRGRAPLFAVGVWLVASVAVAAQPPPTTDLALTISGGVSLGAYEAGLTWTTVRFLRMVRAQEAGTPRFQPHLAAVTGASAGSINALLAAALWCQAPDSRADDGVDDNLMRDTWLPVGLDALLPEDTRRYGPEDGLLSSGALSRVLEDIQGKVFTPNATRRFRPGCTVPLGFSVTRLEPEVRRIAGLPSVTQRFVVSLLFEVTPSGRVRLRHQPLPEGGEQAASALVLAESPDPEAPGLAVSADSVSQALLSSAAFPVAFSPRELCDCATSCPVRHRVPRGTCPGPMADRPLTELTCAARSTPGQTLTLCRRPYVDGGVFDNAPVGLAIELVEATRAARPWWPVTYLFVDPDIRRFEPVAGAAPKGPASGATLTGSLDLFAGLVTTARNSELGRAARALEWNRTSRALLLDAAHENRQFARLHGALVGLAQGRVEAAVEHLEAPAPRPDLTGTARLRQGRWLLSCVRRLQGAKAGPRALALQAACADALRGAPGVDPLADDPAQAARVGERLSPAELVDLGTSMAALFGQGNPLRAQVDAPLSQPWLEGPERLRVQDALRGGLELGASTFEYFAGELGGLALGSLSPLEQARLREALLEVLRRNQELGRATHLVANAVLDTQLQALASMPLPAVAGPAREAWEALRAKAPGTLFSPEAPARVVESALAQLLDPEVAAVQHAPAGTSPLDAAPGLLAYRTRVLGALVGLAPMLLQRAAALEALSGRALALQGGSAPERRLYVSTRFAPLAGSQLGNFAAFLDRPLRELDYYAGVYDALHTFAVQGCTRQDLYVQGVPVPVRRPLPLDELDLTAPDTQRCVGRLMHANAERMGLFASARARHVLTALAREELDATLGRGVAAALVREPMWDWVEQPSGLAPEEPVAAALAAARSHRRPCREGDTEALCLADPGFDAFLEGLRAQGFQAQEASMKLALEDPARWWGTTLRRAVDRATVVELQHAPEDGSTSTARDGVRLALAAGQLWARGDVSSERTPRFELDPSSLPATAPPGSAAWKPLALHLLPYRVAFDAANGGVAVAWVEPALRLSPRLSLLSQVEPLDYESANDRLSSTLGLRPTVHWGGVSLGLGPRASVHWTGGERRFDWGLALHGAVLQDRLGVSVGVRESPFSGGRALRSLTVSLSLADLNGLAYWLTL